MKVAKFHGAGNDFILINNTIEKIPYDVLSDLAKQLCHRRFSIGADGLILADESPLDNHVKMVFFNADGSPGEMCGNGARCLARFVYEEKLAGETILLDTPAGAVEAKRLDEILYWIRLPLPSVLRKEDLTVNNQVFSADYIELGDPGVPHLCVELPVLDQIDPTDLFELGKALRHHPNLPKGANVNFYKCLEKNHYLEKTFERGVEDFTLACGTGSASVAIAIQQKNPCLKMERIRFSVPGGDLFIESDWDDNKINSIDLIGNAIRVFTTEL